MNEPEQLHDALVDAVKACGGTKRVASLLWPAKAEQNLDAARRYLANCLNPECNEKLSLEEVMLVMRKAREVGDHSVMEFLSAALSYAPPQPIEPKDELADLLRQYIQRREQDTAKDDRLQRLIVQHLQPRAA